MMAWPFLFCQKPIVSAPVLQTRTDAPAVWPVWTMVAVLLIVTHPVEGGLKCLEYVKVLTVNGVASVALAVPSVVVVPRMVSVTVMVWLTRVVGLPKV